MDYNDWLEELSQEEKAHTKWREKAKKVEKRYRLEQEEHTSYNILWANVEILQAALYSQTPKPDVQRRFKDGNPIGKDVAMMLERALSFSIDAYDFDGVVQPAVNNYLVSAMGQVRVNYVPFFGEGAPQRIDLEVQVDPDSQEEKFLRDGEEVDPDEVSREDDSAFIMEPTEEVVFQAVDCSTVPWSRFRYSPAKDWDTVWWVGEDHYLTEDQVRKTFVIKGGETIPLGYKHQGDEKNQSEGQLAKVTEIWDKRTRTHFGVCEGIDRILKFKAGEGEAEDDPLGLSTFWPYPKPMLANTVAGNVIPIPDYCFYQDQALEMHNLTNRIEGLTNQLKWRGAYDGSFPQLQDVVNGGDGSFKAIENFAARFDGKGLDAVMAFMPLQELQGVMVALMETREQVKQTIFEVTGISDIVRGATKASETLGAQQLKGQFANMRLSRRQRIVQQFIREIFRIKAEIIAEHFEDDVLTLMTGIEMTPEMRAILESDVLRAFNIDIETDSTVLSDQTEEQEARTQVVTALTEMIQQWGPLIVQAPPLAKLAKQLILFELQAFKSGRVLEEVVEEVFDEIQAALGNVAASPVDPMAGDPNQVGNPQAGNNVSAIPGPAAVGGGGVL